MSHPLKVAPIAPKKRHMKQAPFKLLIVDDEEDLRSIIREIFTTFGWLVEDVENGQKGLEEMLKNKYDFVLSDIRMPLSTGIDMLKGLPAEVKRATTIVMMSAYSDQDDASVQRLGAKKLLTKPVNMATLIEEMATFKDQFKNSSSAA